MQGAGGSPRRGSRCPRPTQQVTAVPERSPAVADPHRPARGCRAAGLRAGRGGAERGQGLRAPAPWTASAAEARRAVRGGRRVRGVGARGAQDAQVGRAGAIRAVCRGRRGHRVAVGGAGRAGWIVDARVTPGDARGAQDAQDECVGYVGGCAGSRSAAAAPLPPVRGVQAGKGARGASCGRSEWEKQLPPIGGNRRVVAKLHALIYDKKFKGNHLYFRGPK